VLLTEPAPELQPAPNGAAESATVIRYKPNEVVVRVEASTPAMLVLSDSLYPGWQATVNGQPTKVYAADSVLRGVAVPAGRHEVVFRYRPRSLMLGAVLSASGLVVVVLCLFVLRRGRTISRPNRPL
jgi:uncharacterized membrane protein YfhO